MAFDPTLPFLTADGREVFQFQTVADEYRSEEYVYEGVLEDGFIYGWDATGRCRTRTELTLVNVVDPASVSVAARVLREVTARLDVERIQISPPPITPEVLAKYNIGGYERSFLSRAETDRLQDLVGRLTAEVEELRSQNDGLLEQVETLVARFGLVG